MTPPSSPSHRHRWEQAHEENHLRRFDDNANADGVTAAMKNRASNLASEVRHRLIESIRDIEKEMMASSSTTTTARKRKLGILLSGGVDSCAILEACKSIHANIAAAVTVSINVADDNDDEKDQNNSSNRCPPPQDELYACEAVRLYNNNSNTNKMEHSIVRLSPAQLIEDYTKPTIKALHLWGYMDTRNSLIISAGLHECYQLGITDILVGDNADELFGGSYDCYFDTKYSTDPDGWKIKRDGMAILPFVTQKLADVYGNDASNDNLGLTVHQPFTDPTVFVDWSLKTTTRTDCIDVTNTCRLQSEYDGPYNTKNNCGKLPLREAFCTIASWRQMDWIFRGSGADTGDCLINHYKTSVGISDKEFDSEQQRYEKEEGIILQSKEHLYNIRIYETIHGGLYHPTKQRYPIDDHRGCISCCFEIGEEQFCHLCDAYPAQHPSNRNV